MSSSKVLKFLVRESTLVVFVAMVIIAAISADRFLSVDNLTNILRQSVPLGLVAIGMLYVILTGGIDLSVGSLMALVSVVLGMFIPEFGVTGAIGFSLAIGVALGVGAGLLVAYFGIAPFIATLASMTIARGLALIFSKGQPIFIENASFNEFGTAYLLGIPLPFYVLGAVVVAAAFVARNTVFGRIIVAIGSNETATRFAGIGIPFHKVVVYGISGLCCAIAGIIAATRTGVGSPVLAIGFELDAIAAVVVGGASLSGGRGTVLNTLVGVLILSIISNIMNLLNIPGYHQQVVKGAIIIVAVLLESAKQRVSFAK